MALVLPYLHRADWGQNNDRKQIGGLWCWSGGMCSSGSTGQDETGERVGQRRSMPGVSASETSDPKEEANQ